MYTRQFSLNPSWIYVKMQQYVSVGMWIIPKLQDYVYFQLKKTIFDIQWHHVSLQLYKIPYSSLYSQESAIPKVTLQ